MTRLLLILFLAVATPLAVTSCQSTDQSQVVHTLQAVGQTAKGAMDGATLLLKDGKIDGVKWQKVADIYDLKFQPAFAVAVSMAKTDLSQPSPAELVAITEEITTLVASFSK